MNKTRFAHAEIIGEEIIINFDGRGLPIIIRR